MHTVQHVKHVQANSPGCLRSWTALLPEHSLVSVALIPTSRVAVNTVRSILREGGGRGGMDFIFLYFILRIVNHNGRGLGRVCVCVCVCLA